MSLPLPPLSSLCEREQSLLPCPGSPLPHCLAWFCWAVVGGSSSPRCASSFLAGRYIHLFQLFHSICPPASRYIQQSPVLPNEELAGSRQQALWKRKWFHTLPAFLQQQAACSCSTAHPSSLFLFQPSSFLPPTWVSFLLPACFAFWV